MPGNSSLEFGEMCNANEENQKLFIDRYVEERVPIDYWWMDAGWYPVQRLAADRHLGAGPEALPPGPAGDQRSRPRQRHQDPRLVRAGTRGRAGRGSRRTIPSGCWAGTRLLNLGNPQARDVAYRPRGPRSCGEQGIDLYRQDFNMDPLDFWRRNDAPDRQGMTENLHVQGYLAYWDELAPAAPEHADRQLRLRRPPQRPGDACAGPCRLHPTDYNYGHLAAKQAFHQSLFQWIPFFGSNTVPIESLDAYTIRSGHALSVVFGYDLAAQGPGLRRFCGSLSTEVHRVSPIITTATSTRSRPTASRKMRGLPGSFTGRRRGDGLVEAFRRPRSQEAQSP